MFGLASQTSLIKWSHCLGWFMSANNEQTSKNQYSITCTHELPSQIPIKIILDLT